MHSYFRAIGFSEVAREADAEKILDDVFRNYTDREVFRSDKTCFVQMRKEYAPDMGMMLCGDFDDTGFHRQYYFPYFTGSGITTTEELTIEQRVNGDSYAGLCDDSRVGVSIIFFLQNIAAYQREQRADGYYGPKTTATFAGLSTSGIILLPIASGQDEKQQKHENSAKRSQLLSAAKNGDEEAIESLTIEDMDLYSMISRRIYQEDLYTIVDTFFMPYGMECDQYQIMGNILYCKPVQNYMTGETIYRLTLESNDLCFDVCINKKDLLGEPEEGRRFKGNIWLQGRVNFE